MIRVVHMLQETFERQEAIAEMYPNLRGDALENCRQLTKAIDVLEAFESLEHRGAAPVLRAQPSRRTYGIMPLPESPR